MATANDRDPVMDPLLSRALSGLQAGDAGCVDAETMAAWVERRLPSTAAAQVESHLSSCSCCQAAMAALVRSMPAPAPVESLWKRWQLGWLVPVAWTAAAIAIYVAGRPPAPSVPELAQSRVEVASEPATGAARSTPAAESPSRMPEADVRRDSRADTERLQKAAPPPAAQENAERDAASPRQENQVQAFTPLVEERTAVSADASRPQASTAAASPPAPTAPSTLAEGARVVAGRAFAAAPVEIRSATGGERWRISADATVQHSVDSGATWQSGVAPVTGGVRAGSSPGAGLCWLVGSGGAVWVATDGITFRRLPFPETIDLTSVLATSARAATVTSSDGRTFRTSDQGMTWSQ